MNDGLTTTPIKFAHILLEGIEVDIEIGIEPHEHSRIQRLIFDVEVGFDEVKTRIPDSRDGLASGFDYGKVRECVLSASKTKTYLLETIANRVADEILLLPHALACTVKVSKIRCWADVQKTSIRISRTRP